MYCVKYVLDTLLKDLCQSKTLKKIDLSMDKDWLEINLEWVVDESKKEI